MTEGASMAETAEFIPVEHSTTLLDSQASLYVGIHFHRSDGGAEPLRLMPGSSEFKVSLKDIELHQVCKF